MRTVHTCAVVALATALLAGCTSSLSGTRVPAGGTGSGPTGFPSSAATPPNAGTATSAGPAPSASNPPTSVATTPPGSNPGGSTSPLANSPALEPQLLAPSALPGFTRVASSPTPTPLPCTPAAPPVTVRYPPQQHARIDLRSTSRSASVGESIYRYDRATAQEFVDASRAGFGCASGTLDGQAVTIVVGDAASVRGADAVYRWDIGFTDGTVGTAIVARKGSEVLGMVFAASGSGVTALNPVDVTTAALAKIPG